MVAASSGLVAAARAGFGRPETGNDHPPTLLSGGTRRRNQDAGPDNRDLTFE
jgi:hypothetical protein